MSEFLAEASVLIQANTKLFRAELAAALATVPKGIEIPVIAVAQKGTVSSAAVTAAKATAAAEAEAGTAAQASAAKTTTASTTTAAAVDKKTASIERAAVATQKMTASEQASVRTTELLAASAQRLAAGEKSAAASATEVAAAQARYRAQVASTTLAERAYGEALLSNDLLLRKVARDALLTAKANERNALASVAAARAAKTGAAEQSAAQAAAAVRTREVTKGLQAQALSAVGLRGAIIGANSAFLAATAGAIIFGKAIQSAAQFQTQLAVFGATTGATAGQLQDVSAAAKQLGSDLTLPGVNAQDAAQAMTELAKAGLSVQDSIDGARGILQLATAAGIDNAQATELAASALNAFGLAGAQASHVADVFANAANDAQGSITDVGIANAQASAAARQAGLSLEQTAGILTIFARNGIKGSDAGTSLRTLLIRLINPTEKANKIIQDLGLHLRDATGGINLGFFDEFERKTRNLTAAERDRDAAVIAGQDAFRGLTILSRTGGVELDNQIDRLNKYGTAADIAAARTSGLAGSAENLKNQLATAGLAIGQSLAPSIQGLLDLTSSAIAAVVKLSDGIGALRAEAQKPIDFIVNVIPRRGGGGEGGGIDKILSDTKTLLTGSILDVTNLGFEQVAGINADALKKQADAFAQITKGELPALISGLNAAGQSSQKFDQTVTRLQALAASLKGGSADTENFRQKLLAFIAQLQDLSALPPTEIPITIPKTLLDGSVGVEAGTKISQAAKDSFTNEMKSGNTFTGGFVASLMQQAFGPAAAAAAAGGAKSVVDAAKKVFADASQTLTLNLSLAQASGNQGKELSLLRQQEANREEFLNTILGRDKTKKNVNLAIEAAKNLDQTRSQIKAITDAQTSAAEKAATDAQTARDKTAADIKTKLAKADQDLLDSFLPAEQRLDVREATANRGGAPQALKAVAVARKKQLLSEIKQIEDNFNDTKAARALIAAKRVQIVNLDAQITSDIKAIFTQGQQDRADALESQVNVAQAEGNIPLQIRLNNVLIAAINKKIASDKLVGKALNDAKAERATLQTANQGLRDQQIQNQIALGQSVADLTGNKDQLVAALDAAIAADRARVRALKAAGKSTTVVQTELNNFLEQRKEVLKKATDEVKGQGITAFDLLKEANDTFNQNAGNLINANQPFAGPTGFTADIAQFLIRRQPPTANVSTAKADFTAPLVSVNSELITVIKENTDALRGKSDKSGPVSSGRTTQHPRVWAADSFWARRFQEG